MTTILASLENLVLVVESTKHGWKVLEPLKGQKPSSLAFDPEHPQRAYSGTFDNRLLKTDNNGQTWEKIDEFNKLPSHSTWSFPPRPSTHACSLDRA